MTITKRSFRLTGHRARRILCSLCLATATGVGAASLFPGTTGVARAALSTGNAQIVKLALAYKNSLSSTQQGYTVVATTAANAAKWSNLPAVPGSTGQDGSSRRNGVAYSVLTTAQQAAFTNFTKAALGESGYGRFQNIRASDNYLGTLNNGYSGNYEYLGFVGTPSATGNWLMQVGGHHNAHNYYYQGSTLTSCTPYHIGVEPATAFTYNSVAYSPVLATQHDTMYAMINSLTSAQLASAKLTTSYSDIYLGPGKDARSYFPTTARGLLASNLTATQQNLALAAIRAWTQDCPLYSTYYNLYKAELASTYVAYSGTTALATQGDYVRIDGPHCWIEIASQGGIVIQGQIHYHTVWRDRVTDYGAAFSF